jgi:hypothetical protein
MNTRSRSINQRIGRWMVTAAAGGLLALIGWPGAQAHTPKPLQECNAKTIAQVAPICDFS